jgi:hypothetical protein
MPINILSRKFYDDQNREVSFLLGNALDFNKVVYRINIEYKFNLSPTVGLQVNGTLLTLTSGSWIDYGFVVGTSNLLLTGINGTSLQTKNITIIDGANLSINSALTGVPDGIYNVGTIECDTKTEGLNVAYNYCKNSDAGTINSVIDGEITRFTVDGLDTLSPTDSLPLLQLGNRSGMGKINGTITLIDASPLIFDVELKGFIVPFADNVPYLGADSLKAFVRFQALPDFNNPNVILERNDGLNGNVGLVGENYNGGAPNYVKTSLDWFDSVGGSIESFDHTQKCKFEARINGTFTSGSKWQFKMFFPTNVESEYKNLTTNNNSNLISTIEDSAKVVTTSYDFDSAIHSSGAKVSFTDVVLTQFSTYALIEGYAEGNTEFTTLVSERDETNRNYSLWVRCENPALDYNSSDAMNVLLENGVMVKNLLPLGTRDVVSDSLLNHVLTPITDTCTLCDTISVTYTLVGEDPVTVEVESGGDEYTIEGVGIIEKVGDEWVIKNCDACINVQFTYDSVNYNYNVPKTGVQFGKNIFELETENGLLVIQYDGSKWFLSLFGTDSTYYKISTTDTPYFTDWVYDGETELLALETSSCNCTQATLSEDTPCPFGTFTIEEVSIFESFVVEPVDGCGKKVITEDNILRDVVFRLPKNSDQFTAINCRVIAVNTVTNDSFILEQKNFDLTTLPTLTDGTKPINFNETPPNTNLLKIPFLSEMTRTRLYRNTAFDTTPSYGVQLKYPMLMRWEDWISQPNASIDFFGVNTKDWEAYQDVANWEIQHVIGFATEDGEYQNPLTIPIRTYDDASIDYTIEFFKVDDTPLTTPINDICKIKVTHDLADVDSLTWGEITVEQFENAPRWFISTTYDHTDINSPLQPLSGETKLKKTITSTQVILECLFDGRILNIPNFTSRIEAVLL